MFNVSAGHIIFCGVAATALMSTFTYISSLLAGRVIRVTRLLGTMLTNKTQTSTRKSSNAPPVIFIGSIAHYAIGILFSLVYFFLWSRDIGAPTYPSGLVFGIVSGVVAAIVWALFYRFHPYPPKIPLGLFLLVISLGHIVFALGVVATHKLTWSV